VAETAALFRAPFWPALWFRSFRGGSSGRRPGQQSTRRNRALRRRHAPVRQLLRLNLAAVGHDDNRARQWDRDPQVALATGTVWTRQITVWRGEIGRIRSRRQRARDMERPHLPGAFAACKSEPLMPGPALVWFNDAARESRCLARRWVRASATRRLREPLPAQVWTRGRRRVYRKVRPSGWPLNGRSSSWTTRARNASTRCLRPAPVRPGHGGPGIQSALALKTGTRPIVAGPRESGSAKARAHG